MRNDPSESDGGSDVRTDFAEDRTLLANERTFAGWVRTGFAAVGLGVGFNALFGTLQPAWVPKAIATLFLLLGAFIVFAAERRACRVMSRMNANFVETTRSINLRLIAYSVLTGVAALISAIWLLTTR